MYHSTHLIIHIQPWWPFQNNTCQRYQCGPHTNDRFLSHWITRSRCLANTASSLSDNLFILDFIHTCIHNYSSLLCLLGWEGGSMDGWSLPKPSPQVREGLVAIKLFPRTTTIANLPPRHWTPLCHKLRSTSSLPLTCKISLNLLSSISCQRPKFCCTRSHGVNQGKWTSSAPAWGQEGHKG